MLKTLLFIFSFFLAVFGLFHPEDQNSIPGKNKSVLYEKVYLHIDRELYSPEDDVWFKLYLVSGISHQLIPGYKNIYVQLINEAGEVADQKLLLSNNGVAKGDFLLPDSLPDGTYTIRAYTRYLQNFGEESYFHKKIVVAGAKSSLDLEQEMDEKESAQIDVAFLPEGGNFVLGPFSSNFLFEETKTNELGNFSFDRLYLKDSALIMINAETKNGSKRTEISVDQPLEFDSLFSPELVNSISPDIPVHMKFYRDIYFSQMAEQEYIKEMGSILLGEVEIEGKQGPQIADHFRLYGEPDHSFSITSDDWNYADIADYLQTKAPGVVVSGDEIRIRAGYGNPLLLVDGQEVTWDYIKYLPLGDVDKIEILKNSALLAVYGSRGGNGVISVLTKMGRPDLYAEYERFVPGQVTPRVKGFQQPRQFYSPKYTRNTINDPKPDFRPTLYWNPEVAFDEREAKIEFYTSDKLARYHVFVEGISKRGKIISSYHLLSVSENGDF